MSEGILCPACSSWICHDDDAWCGFCGAPRARLRVDLLPQVLYAGERPPRIAVRITNPTCATLALDRVRVPAWLRLRSPVLPGLQPNESKSLFVEATQHLEHPASAVIEVDTAAGSGQRELLIIDRKPSLVCDTRRILMWRTEEGRHSTSRIHLQCDEGRMCVLGVGMEGTEIRFPSGIPSEGQVVGYGHDLEMELAPLSAQMPGSPRRFDTALVVDYLSPHGTEETRVPLQVEWCRPPELTWAGEFNPPELRYQTTGQKLRFEFRNQRAKDNDAGLENGALVLQSVELTARALKDVTVRCLTVLPLEIGGGDGASVEFELDLSSLRGHSSLLTHLALKVVTNLPMKTWKVPLKVEPMAVFEGAVAIDFGSSNSCCAVWSLGSQPELLPIDEQDSLVSPTVVRYLTAATEPPAIETGARPKRLAAQSADVAASTADRLKQRLGDRRQQVSIRPESEARWVERNASTIAADYLRNIRHAAEVNKGALFTDFILTHPARCSLRQYARLREALLLAFGAREAQVQFLQEPIAALIGHLYSRARKKPQDDYVIASFDLGGGTTDMALVEIRYDTSDLRQLHIRPRILYCSGEQFGGEDLTDFLCRELSERCGQYLAAQDPAHPGVLIAEGTRGATALDLRLNRASLVGAAEQFKASLSQEKGPAATGRPESIRMSFVRDGMRFSDFIPFAAVAAAVNSRPSLDELFQDYARREISSRAKRLREAADRCKTMPDVIQISGKTTYLPVATAAVAEHFPEVKIVRASRPKECVVLGACQARSLQRGNIVIDLDADTQRMTSTIGAFSLTSPYFQPMLRIDQPIPADGLVGELEHGWDGRESVVLWEDLDGSGGRVVDTDAARKLDRIGAWTPQPSCPIPDGKDWTLRVRLCQFRLNVEARNPDGVTVPFRATQREGE